MQSADRGPNRSVPVETLNHAGVDRNVRAGPRIVRRDGQQSRRVRVPGVRDDQAGKEAGGRGPRSSLDGFPIG